MCSVYQEKNVNDKWKILRFSHQKGFNNFCIPCLRKYSSQMGRLGVISRIAPIDGKVRWNTDNRPFSKMAAENLNKSNLKTNTSTRKSTLTLVTLPSFSISGEISAEKMYVENCKIYRRLYDWGYDSHTNVCKFCNFQHTFPRLIFHLKC